MKNSRLNANCPDNAHVIKILFVCHGNICRSTMAQYVMQDLVEKSGLADLFFIDSAATSTEEIDNPVDPRTRRK
ncbi:MAG: low molecular weight phosphotyrosine protein phosphatase, partial [Atopobium sp.]|nr:low molecular weight phosphotyrosine protein phosphatase [Atopobium sp.]